MLDDALALAEVTGELQRLAPVRVARAEAAWLAGDLGRAADEAGRGMELAVLRENRWRSGELALWLHRAGPASLISANVAEPYALELGGDWAAAAPMWDGLGFPIQAARSRSEAGDEAAVRVALASFERLGARPVAARYGGRCGASAAHCPSVSSRSLIIRQRHNAFEDTT